MHSLGNHISQWLLKRHLINWEYSSGCENFFLLSSYFKYIRVLFALVWSTVFTIFLGGKGGSGSTFLLDRIEFKAKRVKNCQLLSNSLDPLSLRRDVGALSLFYRFYNGSCSREMTSSIPPPLSRPRSTRGAMLSHEFCVNVGNPSLARCGDSFFPATSVLWNSLQSSIFPSAFNLPLVKVSVRANLWEVR